MIDGLLGLGPPCSKLDLGQILYILRVSFFLLVKGNREKYSAGLLYWANSWDLTKVRFLIPGHFKGRLSSSWAHPVHMDPGLGDGQVPFPKAVPRNLASFLLTGSVGLPCL